MPRVDLLQPRRGTAAAWTSANPVLDVGEPGLETDTKRRKTGDGVTAWNSLGYDFDATAGNATYSALGAEIQLPQVRLFNVTLDGNSNESAGSFRWSDGEVGVFTLLATDSTTLEPSSWRVTKPSLSKTFTQPAMTFDASGNVTARPAIVVT